MKLLAVGLLFVATSAMPEKTIYHVAINGATQIKCKITHNSTKAEPYWIVNCDYRCDRPVNYGFDAKVQKDNVYCRSAEGQSPAEIGQPLESEQ